MAAAGAADVIAREEVLQADEGLQALVDQVTAVCGEAPTVTDVYPLGGPNFDPRINSYRFFQTTRSPHSRVPLARSFARRVAEYLEARYEAMDVRTYSADAQDSTLIYWFYDYYSEASWDRIRLELLDDEDYLQLYREADGLFYDEDMTEAELMSIG
jgi:hypothetical protein